MPFEKNNTYGKNNKRGLGKNKEAIKEYLEKICNELIKEMDLGKLSTSQRISLVKAVLPYILPRKKERKKERSRRYKRLCRATNI